MNTADNIPHPGPRACVVRHFVRVGSILFVFFAVDMYIKKILPVPKQKPKNSSNSDSPRPFPLIVDDNNEVRLPLRIDRGVVDFTMAFCFNMNVIKF